MLFHIMVDRADLETVEAGDEFEWHCPECDNIFTRMIGKGTVMSLRTSGHVSLPCPHCEETVELTLTEIEGVRRDRATEYDAADHYHT